MATSLPLFLLMSLLAAAATADYTAAPVSPTPASPAYPTPASPAPTPMDKMLVMVEGVVYCQSCACKNTWSLKDGTPLCGARVTVTCRDAKNRVMASRSAVTDGRGYFLALFDVARAADYYKGDPQKACFVRLLSSPDAKCNDYTDANYGIAGAPVHYEGKRWPGEGYDKVVYAAKPLAFKPARCAPTRHY